LNAGTLYGAPGPVVSALMPMMNGLPLAGPAVPPAVPAALAAVVVLPPATAAAAVLATVLAAAVLPAAVVAAAVAAVVVFDVELLPHAATINVAVAKNASLKDLL
jgi:hypothetical protein